MTYDQARREGEDARRTAALNQVRSELSSARPLDDTEYEIPRPATVTPKDWQEPPPLFRRSSHQNPRVSRDRSGTEE